MACHCDDFSKSTGGRDLRGIEPGMPAAGGHGPEPAVVPRTLERPGAVGLRWRARCRSWRWRRASRPRSALRPHRCSSRSSSPGGIDSLSVLAPVGDSRYASLRPDLALARSSNPDDVFTEDDRLQWHPSAAPLRDLHRAGKLAVMPAIGYTDPTSRTSPRATSGRSGELNPAGRIGWLGRYLDKHGADDNPLQGLSLGRVSRRRWRRPTCRSPPSPHPQRFALDANAFVSDQALRTKVLESFGRQGTCRPTTRSSAPRDGRRGRRWTYAAARRRCWARRSPGRPPSRTRRASGSRSGWRSSRRCSRWACR